MKLYVGNLSTEVTEDDLRQEFQSFGKLDSVSLIKDKFRDVSKGFAFIEMPEKEEAKAAIAALAGKELKGKKMDVNEARPREERKSGFGGNRYGGGGGGRRGGGGGGGGRRY